MARRLTLLWAALCCAALLAAHGGGTLRAQEPEWLEPRGLNIVDLAGQVPDDVLSGAIVADSGSGGIALYRSAEVDGSFLRIRVRLRGRRLPVGEGFVSKVTLLGQRPFYDHAYSATPQSWVRLYEGDREITDLVLWCNYMAPEPQLPEADASQWDRYPSLATLVYNLPVEAHGLRVPANMGGELTLLGEHTDLEATFTYVRPDVVRVRHLASQETSFASYISPALNVGLFNPLAEQMYLRYQQVRHERIALEAPTGANYVLFVYPPSDYHVYDRSGHNLQTPSAGTVRLATEDGRLSQDFTHSGAFPLRAVWQDADQSAGPDYLSLMPPVDRVTPPEFVVPPGIPFDDCFVEGGCPDEVLTAIYQAETPLRIVFLLVEPATRDAQAVPLRFMDDPNLPAPSAPQAVGANALFLPLMLHPLQITVPDDLPRPVGLFVTDAGRMIGYVP